MSDPIAVLLKAWADWDIAAEAMGERERRSKGKDKPSGVTLARVTHAKETAVTALGLNSIDLHRRVAEIRRRHVEGTPHRGVMPVRDALITALLEMGIDIDPAQLKEAS